MCLISLYAHCRVLGIITVLENALAMLFTLLILEPQGWEKSIYKHARVGNMVVETTMLLVFKKMLTLVSLNWTYLPCVKRGKNYAQVVGYLGLCLLSCRFAGLQLLSCGPGLGFLSHILQPQRRLCPPTPLLLRSRLPSVSDTPQL